MDSPYTPPLSPAPQGVARVRSLRTLRVCSMIVGLATMFAAMKLMTMMRSLEVLGREMDVAFSPLTNLLISHRQEFAALPLALGLLAILGSFLKSRSKLLASLYLSIFAVATTIACIAILAVEMQRSILPLCR